MSEDLHPVSVRPLGFCRICGRGVHTASFSDEDALLEFSASSKCQPCQDVSAVPSRTSKDDALPTPVLHGTVFAAAVEEEVREVVLVPFQFDACYGRFAYEPGDVVRAGPELEPLDAFAELGAVRPSWAGRCERVLTVSSLVDPVLSARTVHNHLVIALDTKTAAAAERLNPGICRPPLVDLSAAVRWSQSFGAPLEALLRAHGVCGPTGSLPALRQAALVAGAAQAAGASRPAPGAAAPGAPFVHPGAAGRARGEGALRCAALRARCCGPAPAG